MRGIEIISVALNSVTIPQEDEDLIKQAQHTAILRDPTMAAATLAGAQAEAMKSAAANENGAMMGFMGMGMASQAGGINAQDLYQMGAHRNAASTPENVSTWKCSCGTENSGKFCTECGAPMKTSNQWTCRCGSVNDGKFCPKCGSPRPVEKTEIICGNCGWKSDIQGTRPKFCPQCGNPLN